MSLRDALADLICPVPTDLDPEAAHHDLDTARPLHDADHQLDVLTADAVASSGAGQGPRLAMRAGIQLGGPEYQGRLSTRQAVFGDDPKPQLPLEQQAAAVNGRPQPHHSTHVTQQQRHSSQQHQVGEPQVHGGMEGESSGDGQELGSDGGGEGASDASGDSDASGGQGLAAQAAAPLSAQDAAHSALLAEALRAQQQQEGVALSAMRQQAARDQARGAAVRSQQVLYERALEVRVVLHRALGPANRLPLPFTAATLQAGAGSGSTPGGVAAKLQALQAAAAESLTQLLQLHDALTGHPQALAAGQVVAAAGQVPSASSLTADKAWMALQARHEAFCPFRDSALDRWHARAQLGTGTASLKANLRALNQPVSAQVAQLLRDPARLIARTQLSAAQGHRHIGQQQSVHDDQPAEQAGAGAEGSKDPETYDDGEFYQQLLREFLESSSTGAQLLPGQGAKGLSKKRKLVDRRASKGRKLRYAVQDKLVNFMTVQASEAPMFAQQLFANLFGHQ